MNKNEELVRPYEFSLKINENIICQRYFNINNYNDDCRESLEIKEMLDVLMGVNEHYKLGLIPEFFKKKCISSTWESYNPHFVQSREKNNTKNIYDKEDIFTLEVLANKEVVGEAMFNGSTFQSGVRSYINIKDIIPDIIKIIRVYMSLKDYTKYYGDVELVRNNKFE